LKPSAKIHAAKTPEAEQESPKFFVLKTARLIPLDVWKKYARKMEFPVSGLMLNLDLSEFGVLSTP
jgi:hypothetical protein